VHDPGGVRGGEGGADRHDDLGAPARGEAGLLLELLLEGVAVEKLHHEVGDAAGVDAEVENGHRVRVLHAAGEAPSRRKRASASGSVPALVASTLTATSRSSSRWRAR